MKKLAAILLLGLLVFNFYGYRWLLTYMENSATTRLVQKLDAGDYDESQLMEVKIPVRLQYHNNWSDYETFYGQAEYNGEYYQYVKRKLYNDTLYLLCIPHVEKTKLKAAKTDFFLTLNDLPYNGGTNKSPLSSFTKLLLSEYLPNKNYQEIDLTDQIKKKYYLQDFSFSPQFSPSAPGQPPDLLV